MTKQNAIIMQTILRTGIVRHYVTKVLGSRMGYDRPGEKFEEILTDLDGDVEAGLGKEAEEEREQWARPMPEVSQVDEDTRIDNARRDSELKRGR